MTASKYFSTSIIKNYLFLFSATMLTQGLFTCLFITTTIGLIQGISRQMFTDGWYKGIKCKEYGEKCTRHGSDKCCGSRVNMCLFQSYESYDNPQRNSHYWTKEFEGISSRKRNALKCHRMPWDLREEIQEFQVRNFFLFLESNIFRHHYPRLKFHNQ